LKNSDGETLGSHPRIKLLSRIYLQVPLDVELDVDLLDWRDRQGVESRR
jgi:hypothetical protein